MKCAWKELLAVLPPGMREETDRIGRESAQEIRMRLGMHTEIITRNGSIYLSDCVSQENLDYTINAASRYSPWAAASVSKGFLTAPGGHRIGICGDAVIRDGTMTGIRKIHSLCIRVARDFEGISHNLYKTSGSILILGAPGWGKTTLLRDLIRRISVRYQTAVVDERGELFPNEFPRGNRTDILTGCPKSYGIEMVLRTMGPAYIAVDEITAVEDCAALVEASNCGVSLLATAHASSVEDLRNRSIYRTLLDNNVFGTYVVMSQDKSWRLERNKL